MEIGIFYFIRYYIIIPNAGAMKPMIGKEVRRQGRWPGVIGYPSDLVFRGGGGRRKVAFRVLLFNDAEQAQ